MQKSKKQEPQNDPYLNHYRDEEFERSAWLCINGESVPWDVFYKLANIDWFSVNGEIGTIRFLIDPPSFLITSHYPSVRPLLYDLGILEDPTALYYSWFLRGGDYSKAKGEAHRRAQDFTVECFGKFLNSGFGQDFDRELFQRPGRRVWSDSRAEGVGVWRTRVYQKSIEDLGICAARPMTPRFPEFPYLESTWDEESDREVLRMGGFEEDVGRSAINMEFLVRAANILTKSPVKWGRTRIDRNRFRDAAIEIHNRLWIETGEKPNRDRVALVMGLNPFTFNSRWANTDGDWDNILKPTT